MVVAEIDEGDGCSGFFIKFKVFKFKVFDVDIIDEDKSIEEREERDIICWVESREFI